MRRYRFQAVERCLKFLRVIVDFLIRSISWISFSSRRINQITERSRATSPQPSLERHDLIQTETPSPPPFNFAVALQGCYIDVARIIKPLTVNKWLVRGEDIDLIRHAVGRLNAVLHISYAPEAYLRKLRCRIRGQSLL